MLISMSWMHLRCFVGLGFAIAVLGCDTSPQTSRSGPQGTDPDPAGIQVDVEVSGWEDSEGMCRVAVYDSAQGFRDPDQAIAKGVIPIDGSTVRWSFLLGHRVGDQPRSIAITAYHDRNDNGQLDKNLIGIPTERYGFSKDPKRGYGPPSYEQAAVVVPESPEVGVAWKIPVVLK
jgi:uncharacterized protein (DUF2141 family)